MELGISTMIDNRFNRYRALAATLLVALILSIFAPLLSHMVRGSDTVTPYTDHPAHNVFAAQMRQELRLTMPHPLYHLVVVGIQKCIEPFRKSTPEPSAARAVAAAGKQMQGPALAPVNQRYASASVATLLLFQIMLGAILWAEFCQAIEPHNVAGALSVVFLVMLLLLVGPISALHAVDQKYYFGYIGIHVWHSPTVMIAKPLALLTFLGTLAVFGEHSREKSVARFVGLAGVVVLGALAKPSYLLCLIPAAFFVAIMLKGKSVRWGWLLGAIVGPGVAVILWQSHMYASLTGGSHAKFAPFATMASMSDYLAVKFVLSIGFPLVCYVALPELRQRFRLKFAWVVFFFGLAITYLIKESQRTAHGNFLWSAQLSLFVLFVESLLGVIAVVRSRGMRDRLVATRLGLCAAVLAAHLWFGVAYDVHLLRTANITTLFYQ